MIDTLPCYLSPILFVEDTQKSQFFLFKARFCDALSFPYFFLIIETAKNSILENRSQFCMSPSQGVSICLYFYFLYSFILGKEVLNAKKHFVVWLLCNITTAIINVQSRFSIMMLHRLYRTELNRIKNTLLEKVNLLAKQATTLNRAR